MHGHSRHTLQNVAVDRLGEFFFEPHLFDNNVPFDNNTPIYLINQMWKLGLG